MSGREEQPATVPPPAGEDDAYSAATKVGAMPAEVMAKLRAEGLLPEESEPPAPPARPPTPRPAAEERELRPSTGPVPILYSTVPPPPGEEGSSGAFTSAMPGAPSRSGAPVRSGVPTRSSQPPGLEIPRPPLAPRAGSFGPPPGPSYFPPSNSFIPPPVASSPPASIAESRIPVRAADVDPALRQEVRAFGGFRMSRTQMMIVLVVGLVALVAFAFLMALLSQRR